MAHVEDLPIGCNYEEDYPIQTEKKLFEEIARADINSTITVCREFYQWMADTYSTDMMSIRLKVLEFVLRAEQVAYEKGGMTYRFSTREDYLPAIVNMNNHNELKGWFLDKMSDACQNIRSKRSEKSDSLIEIAKEHIQGNYHKDLSLDDVSRKVNISPYYFRKIFKDGTGENFIEYLTKVRIDKAKELLDPTELSIKEI